MITLDTDQSFGPFQVTLGKIKYVNRVVPVPEIALEINGVELVGDPRQLLDFFDLLLQERPTMTDGLEMDVEPGFLELILRSRIADVSTENRVFPTEEFRSISRDLLGHLRRQVSTMGYES